MRNVFKGVVAALVATAIFSHGLTSDPKIVVVEKTLPVYVETTKYIKVPISFEQKKQIDCLAKNAYFEARDQPDAGVMAVSDVVINRTHDVKNFADTPCKVIAQKKKGVCQFSWQCKKRRHKIVTDQDAYNRVYKLVAQVYLNKGMGDHTHGATFYCANYVHRTLAKHLIPVDRIGEHVFFKTKKVP